MTTAKVLVVDDEADIRALIKDILGDEGYGVTVAADATDANANSATENIKCLTEIPLIKQDAPGAENHIC